MTFQKYQQEALKTATYSSLTKGILCSALGLYGEFVEFKENPTLHEMGDVWWYFAVLTKYLNIRPRYSIPDENTKRKDVPILIGKIQEIIKKMYREYDLDYIDPEKMGFLQVYFDALYTCLYSWSMKIVSDTKATNCAELIWHLNLLKLKDRQERGVLHGSGDHR